MARKSRKIDFVNNKTADNYAAHAEENSKEDIIKCPVFRAGLYARLSFESVVNRERNTIETQMEFLKKFVDQTTDIVVEKEYFDISQTGTDFERSGFDEMMQDVRSGKINCIIVKDLSRLGRNYVEAGTYIGRVLPFFEVRFIAITDGYDSEKGEANLAVCMSNIFNEYYSKDLSKKIKAAARSNWAKGRCVSGNLAYGLKKNPEDKYQIIHDEETVQNVVRMFEMFLNGATYTQIAKTFNEEGLLNPRAYKRFKSTGKIPDTFDTKWYHNTIPKLLSNRYYAGDSVHGQHTNDSFREKKQQAEPEENWIIIENTHKPVVSREIFEQAQKEMERRKAEHKAVKSPGKYKVADRNFFKNKIVCADCGRTMYLQRSGKDKAALECGSHLLKKQCFSHRIHDTDVNDKVLKIIHTHMNVYLDKVAMIRRLNKKQENIAKYDIFGKEIKRYHKELESLVVNKEKLYEDYVSHIIDAEQYEAFKEQDSIKEKELKAKIEELSEYRAGYSINFHTDKEWENIIDTYHNKRKLTKKMVDAFVEKIEIDRHKSVHIHLYYDDMLKKLASYAKEREAENGK